MAQSFLENRFFIGVGVAIGIGIDKYIQSIAIPTPKEKTDSLPYLAFFLKIMVFLA